VGNDAEPFAMLLVSGSTRANSSNTAFCRTASQLASPGLAVECFLDIASLPHFNPDDDHDPLPATVANLRATVAAADAVLFCTPEYAGTLPGSFKNLLDWTVGGGEIYGRPVAWINASGTNAPTGGSDAHASLRRVLGYTGAEIVEDACLQVPIARAMVGEDGVIADAAVRARLRDAIDAIAAHLDAALR
jgi:NAD(P)H-dependent FMN reductase